MRKSIFALACFALIGLGAACNNAADKIKSEEERVDAGTVSGTGTPVFNFEEETHDFGKIVEGTVAEYDFEFTNTGDAPLIITQAQGSCGCTVPNWPKEPIGPGEKGTIHVSFNSEGRTGNQQKTVTLNANTVPNEKILRISAEVSPKAKTDGEAETAEQ